MSEANDALRVLALEAYDGGSHRAFLEGWQAHSRHRWTVLSLPPRKWKWRMRHAAVTFADEARALAVGGETFDVVFASDMLNLAEFRGLARGGAGDLPAVLYFHENQLTYPFRFMGERDLHFGFVNMTSALAADEVWFNSAFHRDDFLAALERALRKMPDYRLPDAATRIRARSRVAHVGVSELAPRTTDAPGPLHILWAARWEHDKDPDAFFAAVRKLRDAGVDFRLSVVGEQFDDAPAVFGEARDEFAARIDRWGYQPTRAAYEAALQAADVAVSTATHEFFGISVVEAIAAGAFPLLPRRLSYPELLSELSATEAEACFYDGSVEQLARRLGELAERKATGTFWTIDRAALRAAAARFFWSRRGPELDAALVEMVRATAG